MYHKYKALALYFRRCPPKDTPSKRIGTKSILETISKFCDQRLWWYWMARMLQPTGYVCISDGLRMSTCYESDSEDPKLWSKAITTPNTILVSSYYRTLKGFLFFGSTIYYTDWRFSPAEVFISVRFNIRLYFWLWWRLNVLYSAFLFRNK